MRVSDIQQYLSDLGSGNARLTLLQAISLLAVAQEPTIHRLYFEEDSLRLVTRPEPSSPWQEVIVQVRDSHSPYSEALRVARRAIPYAVNQVSLVETEAGCLSPLGYIDRKGSHFPINTVFSVVGFDADRWMLALPHRPKQSWKAPISYLKWLDRPLTKLELRLRELVMEGPFNHLPDHPLHGVGWLLKAGLKERWLFGPTLTIVNYLAIEQWEAERLQVGTGVDQALIALTNSVVRVDRADWAPGYFVRSYVDPDWDERAARDRISHMTDIWRIERAVIRAALETTRSCTAMHASTVLGNLSP